MNASAPSLGTCFRAAEVDVEVEWDVPALTPPMEAILSYFGFAPPQPGSAPLRIRLVAREPALDVPPGAERISRSPEGLQFHRSGEALYLHFRQSVVRIVPREGTAYGTLRTEGERVGTVEGRALLEALLFCLFFYSLLTLLYTRGVRALHAACLVRGEHGVLFPGVSDSGKSTLSLRLVEHGWSYLTDDSVLLRAGSAGIEARPLRQDFCLDPEAERLFPQAPAHWEPHLADRRKRRLDIRSLYPDRAASACIPRAVVFPKLVPQSHSALVPISRKAVLLGLIEHGGALAALGMGQAGPHLDDLNRLATQAQGYTLLAGTDLRDDPEAAAALLRDLVPT